MDELRGDRVVLRTVTADDVDALVAVFAEPAVAKWWHGYDRVRVAREMVDDIDPADTVYVVDVDGDVAGVIQTHEELEPDYRRAGIDIALGTRWHGTGVALDALRTLARDLVEARGHHHLTIDPALENTRAIACYRKVGFRDVGVLRSNERGPDGAWHDTLLMDLVAGDLLDGRR
jgi:aminoglycoside 6'-N-acetyltransferase